MTMRSPVQPPAMPAERRRLQQEQNDRSQQIDLFDAGTSTQTPAWRELPEETRSTLTDLMVRLILEHARIGSPAVRTEDGHDH